MKVSKNNVSYFMAGYMAGIVETGKHTPEEIKSLDYHDNYFGNRCRQLYRAYNNFDYHEDGLDNMFLLAPKDWTKFNAKKENQKENKNKIKKESR